MADKPTLGLTLHSNFARHYAAGRVDSIAHAERTMAHIEVAAALQQAHWGGIQDHLTVRDERYLV